MDLSGLLDRARDVREFLDRGGSETRTRVIEVGSLREAEMILDAAQPILGELSYRVLTAMSFGGQVRVKHAGSSFHEFSDPGGPLVFILPSATVPHLLRDERLRRRLRPTEATAEKPPVSMGRRIDQAIILCVLIAVAVGGWIWYRHAQREKDRAAEHVRAEAEYARITPPRDLGMMEPVASYKPDPVYPQAAKAAGIKGDVVIAFLVDEGGTPITVEAVSGPPELREASLAAARRARFYKYSVDGHYVRVKGQLNYHFGQ